MFIVHFRLSNFFYCVAVSQLNAVILYRTQINWFLYVYITYICPRYFLKRSEFSEPEEEVNRRCAGISPQVVFQPYPGHIQTYLSQSFFPQTSEIYRRNFQCGLRIDFPFPILKINLNIYLDFICHPYIEYVFN